MNSDPLSNMTCSDIPNLSKHYFNLSAISLPDFFLLNTKLKISRNDLICSIYIYMEYFYKDQNRDMLNQSRIIKNT